MPGDYTIKAVFPSTLSYKEASATCDFAIGGSFTQTIEQKVPGAGGTETTLTGTLKFSILDENSVVLVGYTGNLTALELPTEINSSILTRIEDNAFKYNTALEKVIIPESVIYLGADAFRGCTALERVTMLFDTNLADEPSHPAFHSRSISARDSVAAPEEGTVIKNYAFEGCTNLTEVTVKNGTTSIGEGAFESCSKLKQITIPNSVKTIEGRVFKSCSSLDNVILPDSVTTLGTNVFIDCVSLNKIKLPSGLRSIPDGTFWNCSSLTSVDIPAGVTSIGENAFFCNSDNDTDSHLTSIKLPAGLTTIKDNAFQNCSQLKNLSLPSSLKTIGKQAFFGCTSFTSIQIPSGVTSLSDRTFMDCTGLKSITVPGTVNVIGDSAFGWCDNLTDITLEEGVREIGKNAFRGTDCLTSITFPSTLKKLNSFATPFEGPTTGVSKFYFVGNAPAFTNDTFSGITATAYYPEGNKTWTAGVMNDYGGNITWKSYPTGPVEKPDTPGFSDVSDGDWFKDAVDWAVANGITSGTSETRFSPNATCTRAQVVTFLWRASGCPQPKTDTCVFTDVRPADYFYQAVLWAAENNITAGTSATRFSPAAAVPAARWSLSSGGPKRPPPFPPKILSGTSAPTPIITTRCSGR